MELESDEYYKVIIYNTYFFLKLGMLNLILSYSMTCRCLCGGAPGIQMPG